MSPLQPGAASTSAAPRTAAAGTDLAASELDTPAHQDLAAACRGAVHGVKYFHARTTMCAQGCTLLDKQQLCRRGGISSPLPCQCVGTGAYSADAGSCPEGCPALTCTACAAPCTAWSPAAVGVPCFDTPACALGRCLSTLLRVLQRLFCHPCPCPALQHQGSEALH